MKKIIGLLILFTSLQSMAQELTCIDKLLPFNRHSGLHMVTRDEWNDGKEGIDAEGAKSAITFLINSKLLCKTGEVVIKILPVCAQTLADQPQSNTCFAYTNVGYFIVSRDNGRNVNLIFSKDKRFGETAE